MENKKLFEYIITIRVQSKSQPKARAMAYECFKQEIEQNNHNPETEDYVWLNKSIEDKNAN